ncbi:MAG: hypothetical protein Q9191_007514 [Dirinaria sp. TL-2023a]
MDAIWMQIGCYNSPPRMLSGTSLQLDRAIEFVSHSAQCHVEIIASIKPITSIKEFWDLFRQYAWELVEEIYTANPDSQTPNIVPYTTLITRAGRAMKLQIPLMSRTTWLSNRERLSELKIMQMASAGNDAQVSRECTIFFGRMRWSVLFIENLLSKAMAISGDVVDECIFDAAQSTKEIAMKALKGQLRRLENLPWITQLYWSAIRADVFSQSSVLHEGVAQLIEAGFALVDGLDLQEPQLPGLETLNERDKVRVKISVQRHMTQAVEQRIIRGKLCEPLAQEAVMQHLRSNAASPQQSHTAKLDNFLRPSDDLISQNRRERFIDILEKAIYVEGGQVKPNKELFRGHYLLSAHRAQSVEFDSRQGEIYAWLDRVANSEHPTFLFT